MLCSKSRQCARSATSCLLSCACILSSEKHVFFQDLGKRGEQTGEKNDQHVLSDFSCLYRVIHLVESYLSFLSSTDGRRDVTLLLYVPTSFTKVGLLVIVFSNLMWVLKKRVLGFDFKKPRYLGRVRVFRNAILYGIKIIFDILLTYFHFFF